ncbi:MAG: hypothetical protein MN733_23440, partial [Nitrososphaera sp.]|nr:hypothetical protein [Nitrososphaera sp.]
AVEDSRGELGYIESLFSRYLLFHTHQKTEIVDKAVSLAMRDGAQLDSLWLSGDYFSSLWNLVVLPQSPERFVSLKFEHQARFEGAVDQFSEDETDEWDEEGDIERRSSTSSITERARRIGGFLPDLQKSHSAFKAVKMLRLPAEPRGGYEFWSEGKVTYRASSFRQGREQVLSVTRLYSQVTHIIEQILWFQVERMTFKDREGFTINGAPLILQFSQPLSAQTFRNLVDVTFERGQGPLRLWGNPIWLSDNKVHVYGIDLHLWQRIYLEVTPRRMIVILPRGTCGNTAHRLITNIQRYIDPAVRMFVGDKAYSDLIRDALLGKLDN